jgi:hypothetical protein
VIALAASPHARGLRKLDLLKCGLSDESVLALARSGWTTLWALELASNAVTDAGGVALANSPVLASVRDLSLASTQISDATAIALAGSAHVRGLRSLSVGHSRITDAGARALAQSPHLGTLRRLNVWHNPLTRAGHEALWARFGDDVFPQRRQIEG